VILIYVVMTRALTRDRDRTLDGLRPPVQTTMEGISPVERQVRVSTAQRCNRSAPVPRPPRPRRQARPRVLRVMSCRREEPGRGGGRESDSDRPVSPMQPASRRRRRHAGRARIRFGERSPRPSHQLEHSATSCSWQP